MTLTDLLIVYLAGMQLVELYHHGSLFGPTGAIPIRAWAERRQGHKYRVVRYLANLLSCPFCEAPWACAIAAFGWRWGGPVAWLFVFALAASRLANLTNDLTHSWSRSPLGDSHSEEELEISESVD
jgi:hypothetical protein